MTPYQGKTLSWEIKDGALELELRHPPGNEIGTAMLAELEIFIRALAAAESSASAVIVYSRQVAGFSAGADLRELYTTALPLTPAKRTAGVREFLERIHSVLNALDCLAAHHDRRRPRRGVRRRIRAGAGLRSDRRR